MKKTKKLLAMVLALMMALSCMAMPAMAAEDEEIMPFAVGRDCTEPNCSGIVSLRTLSRTMNWNTTCEKCSYEHLHKVRYSVDIESCNTCSYRAEIKFYDYLFLGTCMH